jgi:hypothetical protein
MPKNTQPHGISILQGILSVLAFQMKLGTFGEIPEKKI